MRGAEVRLTPKEFKLLSVLASAPGRAFSRTELLAKVFGYDYDGLERTLDVHVMNLRKKLELDTTRPAYIVTVYGLGYRLGPGREDISAVHAEEEASHA
jgi:DNA-binding response OmpR family regulator